MATGLAAGVVAVVVMMLAVVTFIPSPGDGGAGPPTGAVQLADTSTRTPSTLAIGAVSTQFSYDDAGDPAAVSAGRDVVAASTSYGVQHIMGFGADNPEPSPGRYDWHSLDARIRIITDEGVEPVIVLCCSPDWMKGGQAGHTDWSTIDEAPTPDHYDDYAALAAVVARRYPQVRHFAVWNELKGFYDPSANRWNIDGYLALYEKVRAAVKAARPDALVGGPYVVVDSFASAGVASHPSDLRGPWGVVDQRALDVLDQFLTSVDADFVAVDASTTPRSTSAPPGGAFDAVTKLGAVTRWLRARTDLPIWWMEYYPQPRAAAWTPSVQATVHTDAVLTMAAAGASAAMLWGPQEETDRRASLTGDTRQPDGGAATPTADSFTRLKSLLRLGALVSPMSSTRPTVKGWRVDDTWVVINQADDATPVVLPDGGSVRVEPWSVTYLPARSRGDPVAAADPAGPSHGQ